jgi:predicted kinase
MIAGRLIIVCGLPGSGKTTHALALAKNEQGIRFSADDWMAALGFDLWDETKRAKVEQLQWRQAQELISTGLTVVVEWGTWGRSERDVLRLGARALGAKVDLHYLSAPVDLLYERVQQRGMEHPPITRADLVRWAGIFQAPTSEEMDLFDDSKVVEQL